VRKSITKVAELYQRIITGSFGCSPPTDCRHHARICVFAPTNPSGCTAIAFFGFGVASSLCTVHCTGAASQNCPVIAFWGKTSGHTGGCCIHVRPFPGATHGTSQFGGSKAGRRGVRAANSAVCLFGGLPQAHGHMAPRIKVLQLRK
jgi:hypothetical protein